MFLLLMNPSDTDAAVQVSYLLTSGEVVVKPSLAATSRFNVAAGAEFAEARNRRFSTIVRSVDSGNGLPQIVVERSEYADGAGQVWNLGGASLALKLP